LSKTYNTDSQTPGFGRHDERDGDGREDPMGVLSIGQQATRGNCAQALDAPMLTLWELAASRGLGHRRGHHHARHPRNARRDFQPSADRNWESDAQMPAGAREAGCTDIARQIVNRRSAPARRADGRRTQLFHDHSAARIPNTTTGRQAHRWPRPDRAMEAASSGRRLCVEREAAGSGAGECAAAGLFEPGHMQFSQDRAKDGAGEPTLAQMTRAAIQRLSATTRLSCCWWKAAASTTAHHYGNAYRALTDTIALSEAVQAAAEATSADDTLILVTADHSPHVELRRLSGAWQSDPRQGAWPQRRGERQRGPLCARCAGQAYTTLNYATVPVYVGASRSRRRDRNGTCMTPRLPGGQGTARPGHVDTQDPDYLQEALVPFADETHGGDDVGIWARGPGSDAVRGQRRTEHDLPLPAAGDAEVARRAVRGGDCDAQGVPVVLPEPAKFSSQARR
jgi:alkaline phosphatase